MITFPSSNPVWANLSQSVNRSWNNNESLTPTQASDSFSASARLPLAYALTSKQIRELEKTKRTFLSATTYQPTWKQLGSLRLPVHNAAVANRLQSSYTPQSFWNLFEFCRQQGVFNVNFIGTHALLKTAGTTAQEDSSMGHAHWVSDTLYAKNLVRAINPSLWRKSLNTLATYYTSEQPAFERIIREPERYHHGDSTEGVAHIFEPDTLKRFTEWAVNYRLESHGLALQAFCDQFKEDLLTPQPLQQGDTPGQRQAKIFAITELAHYFQAIGYPIMRSCGPWEARPVPNGTTSDIEAVRSGYESLLDLLFNPTYSVNPEMQRLRSDLKQQEQALLERTGTVTVSALFNSPQLMANLFSAGQQIVMQRMLASNGPQEMPGLDETDSALMLVAHSTLRLGDTSMSDVRNHLNVLDNLSKKLVRENGAVRYLPFTAPSSTLKGGQNQPVHPVRLFDCYLGPNYNLAAMPDGSSIFEDKDELAKNRVLSQNPTLKMRPEELDLMAWCSEGKAGAEAEWFLVSDLSTGYGKQLEKLTATIKNQNRMPSFEESLLIEYSLLKETEMLNRAYARITGAHPDGSLWLKANGEACPPFKLPEAYQAVSTLKKNGQPGPLKMIPGINTPLTWATASLYSASLQMQHNLNLLTQMKVLLH